MDKIKILKGFYKRFLNTYQQHLCKSGQLLNKPVNYIKCCGNMWKTLQENFINHRGVDNFLKILSPQKMVFDN